MEAREDKGFEREERVKVDGGRSGMGRGNYLQQYGTYPRDTPAVLTQFDHVM